MDLYERVERLERANRHTKRIGLAMIVVGVLVCTTMGAARRNYSAFDWVSAYGFILRDEHTRDRGGLVYDRKIGPYFCLKDEDGNVKVRITMDQVTRD